MMLTLTLYIHFEFAITFWFINNYLSPTRERLENRKFWWHQFDEVFSVA